MAAKAVKSFAKPSLAAIFTWFFAKPSSTCRVIALCETKTRHSAQRVLPGERLINHPRAHLRSHAENEAPVCALALAHTKKPRVARLCSHAADVRPGASCDARKLPYALGSTMSMRLQFGHSPSGACAFKSIRRPCSIGARHAPHTLPESIATATPPQRFAVFS